MQRQQAGNIHHHNSQGILWPSHLHTPPPADIFGESSPKGFKRDLLWVHLKKPSKQRCFVVPSECIKASKIQHKANEGSFHPMPQKNVLVSGHGAPCPTLPSPQITSACGAKRCKSIWLSTTKPVTFKSNAPIEASSAGRSWL